MKRFELQKVFDKFPVLIIMMIFFFKIDPIIINIIIIIIIIYVCLILIAESTLGLILFSMFWDCEQLKTVQPLLHSNLI